MEFNTICQEDNENKKEVERKKERKETHKSVNHCFMTSKNTHEIAPLGTCFEDNGLKVFSKKTKQGYWTQ